jgi:hypothetical protein
MRDGRETCQPASRSAGQNHLKSAPGPIDVLTAAVTYLNVSQNLDRSLAGVAKTPVVARETEYYLSEISKIKSVDEFMGNKRVLNYALKAFGLGDMAYATAFIRKVLDGGVDDSQSLANRLSDQRYRDFATAFNFTRYGEATTAFERTQSGTVERYKRQTLEENVGQQNEGARLALYFQRKAPELTSSLGLLADIALLKVTQTALGLSQYTSNMSIDAQQKMIDSKLDVADFKDPAKLTKFLNRFTALWDLNNTTATSSVVGPVSYSGVGISSDLLTAIQKIKSGY